MARRWHVWHVLVFPVVVPGTFSGSPTHMQPPKTTSARPRSRSLMREEPMAHGPYGRGGTETASMGSRLLL